MWTFFFLHFTMCTVFAAPCERWKSPNGRRKKGKCGLKNEFTLNVPPPTRPQLWRLIRFGGLQAVLVLVGPQSVSYWSVSGVKQQMDTRRVTRGLFHRVMWREKKHKLVLSLRLILELVVSSVWKSIFLWARADKIVWQVQSYCQCFSPFLMWRLEIKMSI